MIHQETHLVTESNGPRPGGPAGECLYCHREIGREHAEDCVCRRRSVVIRATIEYAVEVPENWDQYEIEFHRNDSSWCASNLIDDLRRLDLSEGCLCAVVKFEFVREATAQDDLGPMVLDDDPADPPATC